MNRPGSSNASTALRDSSHSASSSQTSCSEWVTKSSRASSRANVMKKSMVPMPSA